MLDLDVVLEILHLLSIPLTFQSDKAPEHSLSTLSSCSLVCKTWSGHAQKLLFRRVYLPEDLFDDLWSLSGDPLAWKLTSRYKLFIDIVTADTERGRFLAASVHALVLRAPSGEHVAELLVSLPRLRELDLSGKACILSTDDLARITAAKPDIRSLRLHGAEHYANHLEAFLDQTQRQPIGDLLEALPTIRMLDIQLWRFENSAPRVNLRLVSLKFTPGWFGNSSAVVKQLGVAALELYTLRDILAAPDLDELLEVPEPTLRSLKISFPLTGSYNLSRYAHLERIELAVFPDEQGILTIPLGVVAIAVGPTSELPNVEDFIARLPTFTRLRVITWLSRSGPLIPADASIFTDALRMLEGACKELGIEFRIQRGNLSDDHVEYELRRKLLTS
ncbi:hypothetical protein C8F01DRAFT_1365570 [Mycena amicta]|nr:hypothetical protein C8F01DRAFT_1365570 [Mycena amicta]